MNETMKIYNEHLNDLKIHLEDTMRKIEIVQRQAIVLDDDSKDLIALLMDHYSRTNTNIKCFSYEVENYKKKISK